MERKLKIWTLNQATVLLKPADIQKLCQILKKRYHLKDCRPGNRRLYDAPSVNPTYFKRHPYALMLEDGNFYNEYFVPIPVKCLGNMINKPSAVIAPILVYSKHIGRRKTLSFWEKGSNPRMFTRTGLGYLSILREEYERDGYEALLIGYSQGATVARYLNTLDEKLYPDNPCIAGTVTLSGALKGSPLARHTNRQNITDALVAAILKFTPISGFPKLIKKAEDEVDFHDLKETLWKLTKYAARLKDRNLVLTLMNLSKWLGGLEADVNNAFYDLNPETAAKNGSVLSVMKEPLKTPLFGVITANSHLGSALNEILQSRWHTLRFLWNFFFRRKTFRNTDQAYRKAFIEQTPLPVFLKQWTKIFQTGKRSNPALSPFSHDFIIPSFYQLTENLENTNYAVNPKAAHFTGFLDKSPGGNLMKKQIFTEIKLKEGINMLSRKTYKITLKYLQEQIKKIKKTNKTSPQSIIQTAKQLKNMNFSLPWIKNFEELLMWNQSDLLKELNSKQIKTLQQLEEIKTKIKAFEFITRLRNADPEAWKQVEATHFV